MRFVEMKTQDQLDMQTLHRSRDRLVGERTALINQLRAILLERGIVVPKGKRNLEQRLAALPEGEEARGLRSLIEDIRAQWLELDERIAVFDVEFAAFAKENEDARRLATIPGVGFDCGDRQGRNFRTRSRSRGVAGSRSAPGDDRGQAEAVRHQQARNAYLRKLLIQGAWAALPHVAGRDTALGR